MRSQHDDLYHLGLVADCIIRVISNSDEKLRDGVKAINQVPGVIRFYSFINCTNSVYK